MKYKTVSLTPAAIDLLREQAKKFTVVVGRRVTLSETIERLVRKQDK